MAIEFSCTTCGKQLRTADETAGKKAKCPQCGALTQIPFPAAMAPIAAPLQVAPAGNLPSTSPSAPPFDSRSSATNGLDFNPYQSPTTVSESHLEYGRPEMRDLASRGRRLLGRFIDNCIYIGAATPGFLLWLNTLDDRRAGENGTNFMSELGMILLLAGLLAVAAINWLLVLRSGQSIAKKMLGMQIVRPEGGLPGFLHGVVLRSWVPGFLFLLLGFFFSTANALAIFGVERRCVHDRIAGTWVVML